MATNSTGPAQYAPHAYKGWGALRAAINKDLPTSMRRISAAQRATQSELQHARRKKH